MSSLASLVANDVLRRGDDGLGVTMLQLALSQAGYRVAQDGDFGPRTEMVVKQFQTQHGLRADGVVGPLTAALLDAPHETLVETAKPVAQSPSGTFSTTVWPHDDTASLLRFYGDPRDNIASWTAANVVPVPCPWTLYYEGKVWPHSIPFHRKAADALKSSLTRIWDAAEHDDKSPLLAHVRAFSGSGNFRPVRGSSRLSTHAFWAAIDYDAEHLPLGHAVPSAEMPQQVVNAFKATGAFWGGDYTGRKDPMHFQYAHE